MGTSRTRQWLPGDERREQILQAATRTFAKYGYQRTSIDRVCRACGIARGTLYQYFHDKKHLFREILAAHARKIEAHMVPFDQLGLELPREKEAVARFLAARLKQIFQMVIDDRDLYTILLKEAVSRTTDTGDLVRQIENQFLSLMAGEMRQAQAGGVLRFEDADFAANFFLGGIFKTVQFYVFDADKPAAADELADKVARLILDTIAT